MKKETKEWLVFSLIGLIILTLFSIFYFDMNKITTLIAFGFLALLSYSAYRYSKSKEKWFAGEN